MSYTKTNKTSIWYFQGLMLKILKKFKIIKTNQEESQSNIFI